MSSGLTNLKQYEMELLMRVIDKLHSSQDRNKLREGVAEDLLELLEADFLASFIWNQEKEQFEHAVYFNMTPENIDNYDSYFQFHDPITHLLQARRKATPVYDVMPREELERTEFFNDFLMRDGLHHGINVYAYDGDLNIGDLRIWRAKHRPGFGEIEVSLLDTLLPHFRNALRNVRHMEAAQGIADFWAHLLDNTGAALFLFDEKGNLFHRNRNAGIIEEELSEAAYHSFLDHVSLLLKGKTPRTEWGPFFLSTLSLASPDDSRPVKAVMAYRSPVPRIDAGLLAKRFHLTPREAEICLLVFKGFADQQLASALGISFYTVRTHLKRVFSKLGICSRSELNYVLLEEMIDLSF